MHFYMRVGKKDDIDAFKQSNKLPYLGMPYLVGNGSEEIEGLKHRFLVMPRYGTDIWKLFLQHNRQFPLHTVYRLGWQLINVLEYIHTSTYVHMDIKGSNILLGFDKKSGEEQVHLLDFGLACHYSTKEYKNDPKKAHNGTIEYTSRDAHNGVATLRGDIEVLAFNLIEWAGAKLPWTASQQILQKPVEVQKMKEEFMKNIDKSLKTAFGADAVPPQLAVLVKYVQSMQHDTKPDYKKIRGMFETGLKELKQKNSGKLDFGSSASTSGAKKKTTVAASSPLKRPKKSPDGPKKVETKKSKLADLPGDCSDEEESPAPAVRSTRVRERKKYVESDSDDDVEEVPKKVTPKKPSVPKKDKQLPTPEKKENKTANEPEKKNKATGQVKLLSKATSSKKTVQLNFDLDISFDSDLVVTVNRKDKKKKETDEKEKAVEEDQNKGRAGYYKGKFAK
jgi:vaccinia related kinase